MPETPSIERDPITSSSMSGPFLLFAFLLVLSLIWALYNEFYGLRPWKSYQARFVERYSELLRKLEPDQARAEKEVRQSAAFQKLERELKEAEQAAVPRIKEIDREINEVIDRRVAALNVVFKEARSKYAAVIYELETASGGSKDSIKRDLDEIRKGPYEVEFPPESGSGAPKKVGFSYSDLEREFTRLKDRKAALISEKALVLTEAQVGGLIRKMESFNFEIKQVNILDSDIVDRCESCHLGVREPVKLTKANMGGEAAFTSHPNKELFKIHDPEKFGCTSCHGGNGRATTSVIKAHGRHKYWLWPMYQKENVEAGCQQCHTRDLNLHQGKVLSEGKEIFRLRGCMAAIVSRASTPRPMR
jgi:hypothetical protein